MKWRINSTNFTREDSLLIHYRNTGVTTIHKPCSDNKGIHCIGDKYGYVVEWQITEKKKEKPGNVAISK